MEKSRTLESSAPELDDDGNEIEPTQDDGAEGEDDDDDEEEEEEPSSRKY